MMVIDLAAILPFWIGLVLFFLPQARPRRVRDTPRHLRDSSEAPARRYGETLPRHFRGTSEAPPKHFPRRSGGRDTRNI